MSGRVEWVLTALEQAGVRYLVVGGVAVVLHGRDLEDIEALSELPGEEA
jgi:hypothetical protein